jgi:hypothetical protein
MIHIAIANDNGMSRPLPKKGFKKTQQGEQNTMLSSKAIKQFSGFFPHPFWAEGVVYTRQYMQAISNFDTLHVTYN